MSCVIAAQRAHHALHHVVTLLHNNNCCRWAEFKLLYSNLFAQLPLTKIDQSSECTWHPN
jgi:hypothetical protein